MEISIASPTNQVDCERIFHLPLDNCHIFITLQENNFCPQFLFEKIDLLFPDVSFTVVCSMRLREEKSAGSSESEKAITAQGEEEQEGFPSKFSVVYLPQYCDTRV